MRNEYSITNIEKKGANNQFQYGNCEFLANELHKQFGYKIVCLVRVNNDGYLTNKELMKLDYEEYGVQSMEDNTIECIHSFCSTRKNGKTYYIDSLGITDNINDILERYVYFTQGKVYRNIDKITEGCALVRFNNSKYFHKGWTTYYDENSPYEDNFEADVYYNRELPAIEFVEKYRELLTVK